MTDLEFKVEAEVKEIETLFEMDDAERERREDAGENTDLYDYIAEALSIEYILDSEFTLIGARLYVALGGPTIYVDTRDNEIVGHWGTEKVVRWLPFEIADEMNDTLVELMAGKDGCPF